MTARQPVAALLAELGALGVRLWADEGQLRYRAPAGVLTGDLLARLKAHKSTVLAHLTEQAGAAALTARPEERTEPFPLTDIQAAYLLGRQDAFDYGGVSCHGYLELTFPDLDPDRLSVAWAILVRRHGMLRAVVHPGGYQQVLAEVPDRPIRTDDLRGRPETEVAEAIERTRTALADHIYQPDQWPLYDLRLTRADDRAVLHISVDLLIADYLSVNRLLTELGRLYHHPDRPLPELEITFRDYVLAERALGDGGSAHAAARARDHAYWWDRIDSLPGAPELPLAHNARSRGRAEFTRHRITLSTVEWSALRGLAARHGVTASAAVLSVFAEVIGRWSRNPRFTLNVTLLNRLPLHPQVDQLIGDFTSVNLLEVDRTEPRDLAGLTQALQARLWADMDHRLCTGVEVLRELARRRGRAAALMPVVFTSMIGLGDDSDEAHANGLLALGDLGFGITQTPQVWIDCQAMEAKGQLLLNWDVRTGLFPDGLVEDAFTTFADLLRGLAAEETAWTAADPVALPARQRAVRERVNATTAPLPEGLLHEDFLRAALSTPDAPALLAGERVVSFGELLRQAAAVAGTVHAAGGGRVAVVMDKGIEQVAAVLGVLLGGGAYVPVDTNQPAARRDLVLADAGCRLVLTQSWLAAGTWPETVRVVAVDALEPAGSVLPQLDTDPDELAYVIYTSGSTGTPKGVMMSHRAVLNTLRDINQRFAVTGADRVLGLANLGFDLSVYDIFGVLGAGGALVLPAADRRGDPSHWAELVARHGVTVWNSVPAQLEMLQHYLEAEPGVELPSLRTALLSGDWIPVTLPDRVRARIPQLQLTSLGGATEAAIWSIHHPIGEVQAGARSIPYGTPLTNQTFHVLDHALRPCPDWVPGELYIGGHGLALGYLGDAERTAERFLRHPVTGERLYRTGDLGRYREQGVIEFLGREDNQVKIRGHRIELAEVESALTTHPAVGSAAALVVGETTLDRRLVAFATPAAKSTSDSESPAELADRAAAKANAVVADRDPDRYAAFTAAFDRVTLRIMAGTLHDAGLFAAGARHTAAEVIEALGAVPRHHGLVHRWLHALTTAGLLHRDGERYHGLRIDGETDALWSTVDELQAELRYGRELLDYVRDSAAHLPALFRDEIDPLTLLFPQGQLTVAEAIYQTNLIGRYINQFVVGAVREIAAAHQGPEPLRILEVGAGIGGTSTDLIPALAGFDVRYRFTDLSQFFLTEASKRYADYPWVDYGIFDLNVDLVRQDVRPNSVDVVLCANVLHNAKHIPTVLARLREVLRPGGHLVFIDATGDNHPLLISKEFHEGLSGYEDLRRHDHRVFLSAPEWRDQLDGVGAEVLARLPRPQDHFPEVGQHVFVARVKTDRQPVTETALRRHLAERLPEHMLPAQLHIVDELPLSANGKLDRAALKSRLPVESGAPEASAEPPRDELETALAQVWAELLNRDRVGRDEDFFALGGDSLLAAKVVGRMREQVPEAAALDWETQLRIVLRGTTVADYADHLRAAPATTGQHGGGSSLVELVPGNEEPALVLVHDGSGTLAPYRAMVEQLRRSGRTVLGLEPTVSYVDIPAEVLLPRLAADYAKELRAAGHNRVDVVGYCMGGLLATELARTLTESGAEVDSLTVISCYRMPYRIEDELLLEYAFARLLEVDPARLGYAGDEQRLGAAVQAVLRHSPGLLPDGCFAALDGEFADVAARFGALALRPREQRLAAIGALLAEPVDLAASFAVFAHSLRAVTTFEAEPYAGDITFLMDRGDVHFVPDLHAGMTAYWQELCLGELRIEEIPGDHFTCLGPANAAGVLALLPGAGR
ncbi:amino acid adenylation domain-containing protein [Crossiella sp. CA-258035]|uniref:non-ribosomal peptide synthetase n=1 Tax=Crossiella sp. CA-258035 TaxID=2981138 RepID=UPI0024BD32E5|nr:non-ribosomal peptide synthetase [Crossiella sp. CA-258035]WHT16975.1 amino acid adenylation domain-containing protein [Crossiella sp. CA-258035]